MTEAPRALPRAYTPAKTTELGIAARLGLRRLAKRFRGGLEPAPDLEGFRRFFSKVLKQLPAGTLVDARLVELPATRAPWTGTGITLDAGDRVTTFAIGRTDMAKPLDIWVAPPFQMWLRIGAGPVFRGTRDSHSTVVTGAGGELSLASYFPGEWATPDGRLGTDPAEYAKVSGTILVAVLVWAVPIEEGLQRLAALGDFAGLVAGELDRLGNGRQPPAGWKHLWFLGDSETFFRCEEPGKSRAIACHTRRDVAILQYDADAALEPGLRLEWNWRVDRLPTDLREDSLPSHDYMSIAVEYDNGQDLTYYWSAALPVGTVYRCPLPTWKSRETHVVLRSGPDGLGRWQAESRDIHADYGAAIGGAVPARVKRVWLIANSLFGRGEGISVFADITLVAGERRIPIG
ncbi:DUF3047 domain-containing protein [Zavarzinia compransoris]|nr:DUF3047 domain-containing protein [Zavarzinia compransoris]TDP47062.1 DUF3047 family protein [Zavarzinia compransoris]